MMRVRRYSVDGKASYTARLGCDACGAELAASSVDLPGPFAEHENAAIGQARFAARGAAQRAGAVFIETPTAGATDLCAACAAKLNRLPMWQARILEWFDASRLRGEVFADSDVLFDGGEIDRCTAAGLLRTCGTGWTITDKGTAALQSERVAAAG